MAKLMHDHARKKKLALLALVMIFSFHAFFNYLWLRLDVLTFEKDVMGHLNNELTVYRQLSANLHSEEALFGKLKGFSAIIGETVSSYWSSFFYLSVSVLGLLLGNSVLNIRFFTFLLYFSMLLLSIFYIGKKYKGMEAGIFAAWAVSFFPGVFASSRVFSTDFPLLSAVSLVFCMLVFSESFTSRRYSLYCGLAAGFCLAVRIQGAIFLAGPLLYSLYDILRQRGKKEVLSRMLNFSSCILLLLLICCLFYWRHFGLFTTLFVNHLKGNMIVPVVIKDHGYGAGPLFFYLRALRENSGIYFFVLFLIGIAVNLKRRERWFYPLIYWIGVPYLVFTLMPLRYESYLFPALPAAAIISAFAVRRFSRAARLWLYAFTVAISMVSYFLLSFAGFRSYSIWQDLPAVRIAKIYSRASWAHPPREDRYQLICQRFTGIMKQTVKESGGQIKIGVVEENYFRGDFARCLEYYIRQSYPNVRLFLSRSGNWPFFMEKEFISHSGELDFIIAFSMGADARSPDFEWLSGIAGRDDSAAEQKERAVRLLELLKGYRALAKDYVSGSNISVFLMGPSGLSQAPLVSAAVPRKYTELLIGRAVVIDPENSRMIAVPRGSQDTPSSRIELYFEEGITSYGNILSFRDISLRDALIIEYFRRKEGGKNIILRLEADNIAQIPYFMHQRPSGNRRISIK